MDVKSSPHKLFSEAMHVALMSTRFRPAEAGGEAVRQLVEQTFRSRSTSSEVGSSQVARRSVTGSSRALGKRAFQTVAPSSRSVPAPIMTFAAKP